MPNLIGTTLGRYHILEQLGEGGMATVYKAYDTLHKRDVAIKIIRADIFGTAILERIYKRFEREARSLAKLSHPNIVNIIEYGEHEGSPFLVMEYISGGTLKQNLGKPIPWSEAIHLLLPIAQALDVAHKNKIIHRDVKPSNILIAESGQPKLTDFGIAKVLEADEGATLATTTGVGVGTPEYMAPEQGLGHEVDARADIYSLGIVLYELITGRKPFRADTPMAVIIKHVNDPLPRLRQFVRGIPESVERILLKALAKKPEDRFQNMAELEMACAKVVEEVRAKERETALKAVALARKQEMKTAAYAKRVARWKKLVRFLKSIKPWNNKSRLRFAISGIIIFILLFLVIQNNYTLGYSLQNIYKELRSTPIIADTVHISPSPVTEINTILLSPTVTITSTPNPRANSRVAQVCGSNICIYNGIGKFVEKFEPNPPTLIINSWGMSWSPDGTKLVLAEGKDNEQQHKLYVFDTKNGEFTKLTHEDGNHLFPSWSPDGKYIAYHLSCTSTIISLDNNINKQFGNKTSVNHCANTFRWSPDSKFLAWTVHSVSSGHFAGVEILDVASGTSTFITFKFLQDIDMAWNPDGTRLYILSENETNRVFVYLDTICLETQCTSDNMKPATGVELNPSWLPNYYPQWQVGE